MQKNISILFLIINNEIFYEIIRMFFYLSLLSRPFLSL